MSCSWCGAVGLDPCRNTCVSHKVDRKVKSEFDPMHAANNLEIEVSTEVRTVLLIVKLRKELEEAQKLLAARPPLDLDMCKALVYCDDDNRHVYEQAWTIIHEFAEKS